MSAGISREMILSNIVPIAALRSEVLSRAERVRERRAVDELELAAERHAVGEPRRADAGLARELADVLRGRLALDGRIRRDDELADLAFREARREQVEPELLRSEAVERRQAPEQDEIAPPESRRVLERGLVDRRLDHAEARGIARGAAADRADGLFAEGAAARAVADPLDRVAQLVGEPACAGTVTLEHVERHALRRLRADAGQHAQRLDELVEQG